MTEVKNPYAATTAALIAQASRYKLTEIADIARAQRFLIWLLLLSIFTASIPFAAIIFLLFLSFGCWRLWRALRYSYAPVGAILGLLPVINWIVIIVLNRHAIKQLQEHGIVVGFMGVSRKRIERIENEHLRKIGAL